MTASVATGNQAQLEAWDGAQGQFWREQADRFDDGVTRYSVHLLAAVAATPGMSVLDVGCGSGQVTRDVAQQATGGAVLGVDLSSPLLTLADERAERDGLHNVSFLQADAQIHPFAADTYDVVVGRHGTMFFADPEAAFTNLRRALRPGGRLVALTWQAATQNPWVAFRTALELPAPPTAGPGPFSLSDPTQVRELLSTSGFVDVALTDLREPMWYGANTDDAMQFLSGQFAADLAAMSPEHRTRATEALRALLEAHDGPHGVQYDSAAWLIEAQRPR